ncbi:cytochrome P450 [Clavulina sp. PMI_390]|nr:cytochrome P450 [Clavulina sp. PMI_390]
MALPPGIPYVLQLLPAFVGPPLLVYAALHYLRELSAFSLLDSSPSLRFLLVLLSLPVAFYVREFWIELSYWYQARRMGARMLPQIQGKWYIPAGLDLIADLISAIKWEYAGDSMGEILRPNKTVVFRAVGDRRILTKEPRYIKHILAGNFTNYVKGEELFGRAARRVLGVGVFNSDGVMWKFHRTLARPFFTRDRISDFKIFEKHADSVIGIMRETFNSGIPLDIQDVFARFTLDSATEFLFGDCVHSIYEPMLLPGGIQPTLSGSVTPGRSEPSSSAFVKAFAAAQEHISTRVRMGRIWPLAEILRDKSDQYAMHLKVYIEPIVERALHRRTQLLQERNEKRSMGVVSEKEGIEEGMTLLDHLVLETDDRNIIRDSLMNMLIAGRDTTACLLTFATYALSQHSDVLAKLREEILSVIGPTNAPTYDSIRELKYLRAVLNETLRLFPPVPLNYRESVDADVWTAADDTRWFIPAGTTTGYSVLSMHRDKDLWGEDALVFDPMRWIDERLAILTANPFMFLPFNAGPRICLGQQFAYNEASFMLVRLLQTFNTIALRPEAQPHGTLPNAFGKWDMSPERGTRNSIEKVWPRRHLTTYVQGGMWAVMGEPPGFDGVEDGAK